MSNLRFSGLVALGLLATAVPAQAQIAKEMPEAFEHCENRGTKFDAEDQIQSCGKLIAAAAASPTERYLAYRLRAEALYRSADYDSALADVSTAIDLAPDPRAKGQSYYMRAVLYSAKKNDAAAVADLDRAIAANPAFAPAFEARASLRSDKGDPRGALADYDKAIALDGRRATARNGSCWVRAADLNIEIERARRDCDAAIALKPDDANIRDSRGMVELRAGNVQAAFDNYTYALGLDPNNASALYGRGVAAIALGRKAMGDADIAKAKGVNPKVAGDYSARGIVPGRAIPAAAPAAASAVAAPTAGAASRPVPQPAVAPAPTTALAAPTKYPWRDAKLAKALENECEWLVDVGEFALHHRQRSTLAETDAEFVDRARKNAPVYAYCLRDLKRQYPLDATLLEQAAVNAKADIDASIRVARAQFLGNPAKYMESTTAQNWSASAMRAELAQWRTFQTLAQRCGTFDYSIPAMDNAILRQRRAQRVQYAECAKKYSLDYAYKAMPASLRFHLEATRDELDSYAPYVCSRYKVSGCIPDSRWKELDGVTSPANIAFVKRMEDLRSAESNKYNDVINATNKWADDVEAAVQRFNRGQ